MTERAPDLIGPIVGWRAWYVRETGGRHRLHSIHYGEPWPVRNELTAACHRGRYVHSAASVSHDRHDPPTRDCVCGIYGAKELEQAQQYFGGEAVPADYVHRVVGQVKLWGSVVECTQGFRASHAYPAHLWLPTRRPDGGPLDIEALALDLLDYGVPVELLEAGNRAEIMGELGCEQEAA